MVAAEIPKPETAYMMTRTTTSDQPKISFHSRAMAPNTAISGISDAPRMNQRCFLPSMYLCLSLAEVGNTD